MTATSRRYPIGAEILEDGVHFRVWAPRRKRVRVVVDDREHPMQPEGDGYHAVLVRGGTAGARYGFRLDDSDRLIPDPASRYQPEGPHALSAVIDPHAFRWSDGTWRGPDPARAVLYEMHVGTFTPEGTWAAAQQKLGHLADVGINVIEMMPIGEFPGRFGWGYDGVDLWAPWHGYGTPDDLRRFVDHAHSAGISVILDVVYNHLGPSGNYLREFSPDYFTDRYENDWGDAINFDGPGAGPVRDFFSFNAAYWIDEFHFDGLRLDAAQNVYDTSSEHVLALVGRRARAAAKARSIYVIAENETQDVRTVRDPSEGGHGFDGIWNDDFHHSARVALTGRADAYYSDYLGSPQEFVSMARHGFLYQGQWYTWQEKPRGTPSVGVPGRCFVWFLQNHDQVANTAVGERLTSLADPPSLRAMTALVLLGPATPLIFQGDEFGASAPFAYFADHEPELAAAVAKGRREFLVQFPDLATGEMQSRLPRPDDPAVFERCRIDWAERESNPHILAMHRDLLRIRREDPPFGTGGGALGHGPHIDGAVLADHAFLLRSFRAGGDDRLLVVNLGAVLRPRPVSEPLLAPPAGRAWKLLWSSESPEYGGTGTPPVLPGWLLPPRCCVLLGTESAETEAK